MKKIVFLFAIATMMVACGEKTTEANTVDSTATDSAKVDSVKVDTAKVTVDTIAPAKADSTKK